MAENKTIEVRYYGPASEDFVTYTSKLALTNPGSGSPIEFSVRDAHFRISRNERILLDLTLNDNIVWNDGEKSIYVFIRNSELGFIRADTELNYSWWVVWENGTSQTLREGTVTAVRVD